jgi:uncharacterized protein (UPF0335 family)
MAPSGHNANAQLKSLVERIENLNSQIQDLQDDRKEIFAEAKSSGFDGPALRQLIRERKEDKENFEKRENREQLLEVYRNALLGLADLPLGRAALERAAS